MSPPSTLPTAPRESRFISWLQIVIPLLLFLFFLHSFPQEAKLTTKLRVQQTERELGRSLCAAEVALLTISTWDAVCGDYWDEYYERVEFEREYLRARKRKNR